MESVEVTGPMQIALHLKTPDAALLMQLTDRAGAMMAPDAAKSLTLPPIRSVPVLISLTAACPRTALF